MQGKYEKQVSQEMQGTAAKARSSLSRLQAVAVDAAIAFVADLESDLHAQEWQLVFRLARRLKGLDGAGEVEPDVMEPAVRTFCRELGRRHVGGEFVDFSDEEARFIEFVDCWYKLRFPEAHGPLELAFAHAERAPITPARAWSVDYVRFVSTAFHLQVIQGEGEPIVLPVERLGRLFGRDAMYGSRLVSLAVRAGLLEPVDLTYSYQAGRAKTYRFRLSARHLYDPPVKG